MPREKKYYSYWELPTWFESEIYVAREFQHPMNQNKTMLSLRQGDKVFVIAKPKRKEWNDITAGMTLKLTKISTQPKNAHLNIVQ